MLTNLSNLGMGKKDTMEEVVSQEVEDVESIFSKEMKEKGSVAVNRKLGPAINNVIWRILTGKRTKQSDLDLVYLTNCVSDLFEANGPSKSLLGMLQAYSSIFLKLSM